MPSFKDIQEEIKNERVPETPYDVVRRKYLKKLHDKTGRNVILYLLRMAAKTNT